MRRVKEGTSAVLLQSGLNENWWAGSMECYFYLRNNQDLLSDEKTPGERRFGQPFKGPIIPFGSLVEYYSFTAKDQSRIHQYGKKVLLGFFLGYASIAGRIWKGDVLVADIEELESMDASEIYAKRLNAKEVIFHSKVKNSYYQSQMGKLNLLEEIRNWEHPPWCGITQFEERSTKWFLVHVRKLHMPPSRWTQSQTLLAEVCGLGERLTGKTAVTIQARSFVARALDKIGKKF